jgi:hypothetical protein
MVAAGAQRGIFLGDKRLDSVCQVVDVGGVEAGLDDLVDRRLEEAQSADGGQARLAG